MNKPLLRLDNGSYQPISAATVRFERLPSSNISAVTGTRSVEALFAGVGEQPIPSEGLVAAEDALSRFAARAGVPEDQFYDEVAAEFSRLRE